MNAHAIRTQEKYHLRGRNNACEHIFTFFKTWLFFCWLIIFQFDSNLPVRMSCIVFVFLIFFCDVAGLVKIFLWTLALGSSDVLFVKLISQQVKVYLLTPALSSHLCQSHGKVHSCAQIAVGRKMQWKAKGLVELH